MLKKIFLTALILTMGTVSIWAADDTTTGSDNVVIVLDASGSMDKTMGRVNQRKMDAAKEALVEVIRQVPKNTKVGLLVFSSANLSNDWAYPLSVLDPKALETAIRLPRPYGKTPLGKYIKKGADRLLQERALQFGYGTYRLLIVTDGEAHDRVLVDKYVPDVLSRGIIVDVIGVDMNRRHTLATKVHSYRSADDPDSLKRAVKDVFAEIGGTGSDDTGQNAFDALAPIQVETAQAMIKALSIIDNRPIGENAPQSRK